MAWIPFGVGKKDNASAAPRPQPPQLEQRSHQPLGVLSDELGIQNTLNQIATSHSQPEVQFARANTNEESNNAVTKFVESHPKRMFIIDGEKYANESIICTNDERGEKTCLRLGYNSIQLFKQMQKLEYFCSLPNDIDATYFECRKIT